MSNARQISLAEIKENGGFDAVVIGGGVNGIGVYRDLSLQGLRVLLVERNDFASGCSAAPSRMIHGGLRYLENGEFDLVKESLRERDALLRNAPHMVKPLPTVIPVTSLFSGIFNSAASFFGWQGQPSSRGALPIKLGLSLYDWVTRKDRALPRHSFQGTAETRTRWPALTREARYSAVYYDAWISHPERLCIEMISDVAKAAPQSIALNYAEIVKTEQGYELTCQRSGQRFDIQPHTVVHATGAWLNQSVTELVDENAGRMVGGTKGSHLIIDNAALERALDGHMAYFENADGRVCIVFPYQGKVLAGSTDIRVETACKVRCEDDELIYILESLRQVFPDIDVAREDVVFSFSGIRPLPESTQEFTGRISRGHDVKRLPGDVPQFCMIGGKWTTFRAFAEQAADMVLQELQRPRRIDTMTLPIGGGKDWPENVKAYAENLKTSHAIGEGRVDHLLSHYGSGAEQMQCACAVGGADVSIGEGALYSQAEVRWLIRNERVQTLSDLVFRRTSLAITGAISSGVIHALALLLAEELNLSRAEVAEQERHLIEELSDFYGVTPEMLEDRTKEWSKQCA